MLVLDLLGGLTTSVGDGLVTGVTLHSFLIFISCFSFASDLHPTRALDILENTP